MTPPRRTYAWPIPKGTTLHIRLISKWQLGTYQHNIPITSQVKKGKKRDDPKSEDKDSITCDTAKAHVEDSTINEDTTPPSTEASLGAKPSNIPSTTYGGRYIGNTPYR